MTDDAKNDPARVRPQGRGLFLLGRALPVAALAMGLTLVFPASMAAADEGTSTSGSATVPGQEPAEADTSQSGSSGSGSGSEPTAPATTDPVMPDPETNSGPGSPAEEPAADDTAAPTDDTTAPEPATEEPVDESSGSTGSGSTSSGSTSSEPTTSAAPKKPATGGAQRAPAPRVTICHRTNSHTNPYNQITVAVDSANFQGHTNHTGPIFHPGIVGDWGDIIPPVPGFQSGLNWPEGRSVLNNGCEERTPPDVGPQPSATAGDLQCTGVDASVDVTVSNAADATGPAFFTILEDSILVRDVGPVAPGDSRTVTLNLDPLENQTVTIDVRSGGQIIASRVITVDCQAQPPDVSIRAVARCVNGAALGTVRLTNNGNAPVTVTATVDGAPIGGAVVVAPGETVRATEDLSRFEDQTITVRLFVDGALVATYVVTPDCVAPEAIPGVSVSGMDCPPPSATVTLSNTGDPDSSIVFVIRVDGKVVQTSSPVFGGESTTIVGDLSRFEDQTVTIDLLANGDLLGSRTIHVNCVTVAGAQGSGSQPGAPRPPVASGSGTTTSNGTLPSVGAGFSRSLLALGLALVGAGSFIIAAGSRTRRDS